MKNIKKIIIITLVFFSLLFVYDNVNALPKQNSELHFKNNYLVKKDKTKVKKEDSDIKTDDEGVPIIDFEDLKSGVKKEYKVDCEDWKDFHGLWTIIIIGGPFVYIIFAAFDFFKIVMAGNEEEIKKAKKNIPKRLIIFMLFILVPFFVVFITDKFAVGNSKNMDILRCVLKGSE